MRETTYWVSPTLRTQFSGSMEVAAEFGLATAAEPNELPGSIGVRGTS